MGRKIRLFDDSDENRLDPLWRPVKPVGNAAAVDDRARLGADTNKTALKTSQSPRLLKPMRVIGPARQR
jgi:hypothetical protein